MAYRVHIIVYYKQFGRIHTYEEFLQTYHMARKIGFKNINVDLMLALPGQTIKQLESSLKKVILLEPEHISVYSLIIEENTELYKKVNNGSIKIVDDSIERKMYWKTKQLLEEAGYEHYEISNFSKKGYNSKHNMNCWEQKEYLGVGVAAHSYLNKTRFSNINEPDRYIENVQNEKFENNKIVHELQKKEDEEREYIILSLRKLEGMNTKKFQEKFKENPEIIFQREIEKMKKYDLLESDGENIKFTKRGLDFANIVWEEFV